MSPCPQAASNPAGVSGFSLPRGRDTHSLSGKGMFKTGVPLTTWGKTRRRKTYAQKSGSFLASLLAPARERSLESLAAIASRYNSAASWWLLSNLAPSSAIVMWCVRQ
jgi:hypothetical protein